MSEKDSGTASINITETIMAICEQLNNQYVKYRVEFSN